MTPFTNILFPVDFSDRCGHAASYVASVARTFNSKVTLLHVIDTGETLFGSDTAASIEHHNWLHANRENMLAVFGSPCLDPFVTARLVKDGDPAEVVIQYAETNPVNLIAMPTHGRGMFRRLLLGSVTSKVLHDSTCPVLTMTHTEDAPESGFGEIRRILCAIDLASDPSRIFKAAQEVAQRCGASLRIVNAVPVLAAGGEVYMNTEFSRFLMDSAVQQIADLQREAGTAFEVTVDIGDVATLVRDAAEAWNADLVIIGRGCVQESFGRLRSNVGPIIQKSPCPVLSF